MQDFPKAAIEVAEYFETNYLGRRLPDQTRRMPPFPIRFWNMLARVLNHSARTNNYVEGGIMHSSLEFRFFIPVSPN